MAAAANMVAAQPMLKLLNLTPCERRNIIISYILLLWCRYLAENPNVASSCAVDDNGDFIDVDVNYACQKVHMSDLHLESCDRRYWPRRNDMRDALDMLQSGYYNDSVECFKTLFSDI